MKKIAVKYKVIVKRRLSRIKMLNEAWFGTKLSTVRKSVGLTYGSGNLRVSFGGKRLLFRYADDKELEKLVDLMHGLFVSKEYAPLSVENKRVIDIGGNVGDTALYFAARGARHVYVFEPSELACKRARENVKANGFQKRITIINAGVGNPGEATTASDTTDPGNVLSSPGARGKNAKAIKILSLGQVCKKFGVGRKDFVLKIDCEGCEYGILTPHNAKYVRQFPELALEYHSGADRLEKFLETCGYVVKRTGPFLRYDYDRAKYLEIGMLYARMKSLH